MRLTFLRSASLTSTEFPSFFLRFLAFEVRMWRRNALWRFTFPVPVFLKRLAAPLCVFSLGIKISSQFSVVSSQLQMPALCGNVPFTRSDRTRVLPMADNRRLTAATLSARRLAVRAAVRVSEERAASLSARLPFYSAPESGAAYCLPAGDET